MPLNQAHLVGASLSPIQSLQPTTPIQSLASSPGNITPMSIETAVLNSGTSSTIVSLPQSFCFPNSQIGNCAISSGVTVAPNPASNGATTQLNPVSLGSVFGVSADGMPQQFVQPLTVTQQQALALPVNQQQQQTQQTLSVPHALTLGQVPQGMGLVSQSVPIGQVVCSSVATPLSFMNPTIFTVSSPAGQPSQYISNSFPQFPFVLGNQQSIFTGINASTQLSSQHVDSTTVNQVSRVGPAPQTTQTEMTNCLESSHISNNPVSASHISSNPASLSCQPVSVFSFASPAMSVTTSLKSMETSSQPSPDTTITNQSVSIDRSPSAIALNSTTNLVSSSTHSSFIPISLPSVTSFMALEAEGEPHIIKTETDSAEKKVIAPESFLQIPGTCRARMKFTPVDPENMGSSVFKTYLKNVHHEDSDIMDNAEEDDCSVSGLLDIDERASPENQFQSLNIKSEPYENDGDEPDDDSSKHSASPIESLELSRNTEHQGDTKADTLGDLADGIWFINFCIAFVV